MHPTREMPTKGSAAKQLTLESNKRGARHVMVYSETNMNILKA